MPRAAPEAFGVCVGFWRQHKSLKAEEFRFYPAIPVISRRQASDDRKSFIALQSPDFIDQTAVARGLHDGNRPSAGVLVMRTILYSYCLALWLSLTHVALVSAAEPAPDALVKSTVEEVLGVIRQNKDKRALRELAEQKVLPKFDFRRMTQLAAGPAWRQANPAQQQALENGFRTLLVNTYTAALSATASGTQTVDVRPLQAKADEDEVTVKTLVKDAGKPPLAIDYRMEKSPDGWKVFDVVVENLSLVINHRGTFAAEVERSGIDGLIKALEQKNRAIANS